MIENVPPEAVRVTRTIGSPFIAKTRRWVFADNVDRQGNVIGKGSLIGIEVEDERGFLLFAQPSMLEAVA